MEVNENQKQSEGEEERENGEKSEKSEKSVQEKDSDGEKVDTGANTEERTGDDGDSKTESDVDSSEGDDVDVKDGVNTENKNKGNVTERKADYNVIRQLPEAKRKKLLQSLHPNKRQLRMWDPELIAMKQRALVSQIYGEQIDAPFWHPNMLRQQRPYWAKYAPSSAALSYNFAIDQYHPLVAKQGMLPSPFLDEKGHPKEFLWQAVDEDELQGQLNLIRLTDSQAQSKHYSYNMRK